MSGAAAPADPAATPPPPAATRPFPADRPSQDAWVVALLVRLGLTTLDEILDHGIHLQPFETRNRNVAVRIRPRLAVHLKLPMNEASRVSVRGEAAILDQLTAVLSPAARVRVPRPRALDAESGGLLTGLLDGVGLHRDTDLLRSLSPVALGGLARLLREVHAAPCGAARDPRELPFATGLPRPALSYVHNASSADLRLVQLVQNSLPLRDSMQRLARDWRQDALVHGDMKLDNLLLLPGDGGLALLDWEYARRGDARWDVGSLLAELIHLWIQRTVERDLDGGGNAGQAAELPQLRRLVGAFVSGYGAADPEPLLLSCADCVVARLLQSALEAHKFRTDIDLLGVRVLQAAENIARTPDTLRHFLSGPR